MKKIAIAIDDWKQSTFERILTKHGYTFEVTSGITSDTRTIFITIPANQIPALTKVIQECQRAAATMKG